MARSCLSMLCPKPAAKAMNSRCTPKVMPAGQPAWVHQLSDKAKLHIIKPMLSCAACAVAPFKPGAAQACAARAAMMGHVKPRATPFSVSRNSTAPTSNSTMAAIHKAVKPAHSHTRAAAKSGLSQFTSPERAPNAREICWLCKQLCAQAAAASTAQTISPVLAAAHTASTARPAASHTRVVLGKTCKDKGRATIQPHHTNKGKALKVDELRWPSPAKVTQPINTHSQCSSKLLCGPSL